MVVIDSPSAAKSESGATERSAPDIPEPVSPRERRRARRRERYRRVHELAAQGLSQRAICEALGLSRKTVRRFLHAREFPERTTSPRSKKLTPFLSELQRLWNEGCHNARILTDTITAQGYRGTYYAVRRRVRAWRQELPASRAEIPAARRQVDVPSANRTAWLLFLPPQELDADERRLAEALQEQCPTLRVAARLAQEFAQLVKQRRSDELANWLQRAGADDVPVEIRNFAHGLRAEWPSIEAAIRLPWSNAQAEGQINRLKLVKRQMYGRANFDLLKLRFLLGQTAA